MMITLTLWQILVVGALNVGVLAFLVFDWFRKNYTIVDLETWNTVVEFYNNNADQDETQELAGGCGFFREYLYDEEDEEEEEQPEEDE